MREHRFQDVDTSKRNQKAQKGDQQVSSIDEKGCEGLKARRMGVAGCLRDRS